MDKFILIIIFALTSVFFVILGKDIGKKSMSNLIFGGANEIITEVSTENKDDVMFVGLVYDVESPTYKMLSNSANPFNISIEYLQELLEDLEKEKENPKTANDRKFFVMGQIDLLKKILKKDVEEAKNDIQKAE